jgi:hypothetical protein
MCLYPKLIKNPKYKVNKKNNGNVPQVNDLRVLFVPIGCGQCIECRKKRANEWKVRLSEEIRTNHSGLFVTLTFSNKSWIRLTHLIKKDCRKSGAKMPEGYDLDNAIATRSIRMFFDRFRKGEENKPRYFLITELGHQGTENLHFHGIIFDTHPKLIKKYWFNDDFVYFGYSMTEKTISYIVKYITKIDTDHPNYVSKIYCSSGLGAKYVERLDSKRNAYQKQDTNEEYRFKDGSKVCLPVYYRNKLYSDDEKENLWLYKLDEQKRYVLGSEIDVSKTLNVYFDAVHQARRINKRLGFGDGSSNHDSLLYENQLRRINHLKRHEAKSTN